MKVEGKKQNGQFALMQILSEKIPMSTRTIENRLNLLHLPKELQNRKKFTTRRGNKKVGIEGVQ